ncbi:MAG: hypothetical protein JSV16_15095, partial [Candidatus Hydrogenedentota bacterium]
TKMTILGFGRMGKRFTELFAQGFEVRETQRDNSFTELRRREFIETLREYDRHLSGEEFLFQTSCNGGILQGGKASDAASAGR